MFRICPGTSTVTAGALGLIAALGVLLLLWHAAGTMAGVRAPEGAFGSWCIADGVAWPGRLTANGFPYCDLGDKPTAFERWWSGPYCPTDVTIGDALRLAGCGQ